MKQSPMIKPAIIKTYVKVTSDFDKTGYMQPRVITMDDGRRYVIDQVCDFRPADTIGAKLDGDCYTILIHGKQRYLFFERTSPLFRSRFGRWFLEGNA